MTSIELDKLLNNLFNQNIKEDLKQRKICQPQIWWSRLEELQFPFKHEYEAKAIRLKQQQETSDSIATNYKSNLLQHGSKNYNPK